MMEKGDMGVELVALGREVFAAQSVRPSLINLAHFGGDDDGCGHRAGLERSDNIAYPHVVIPNLIGDPWPDTSVLHSLSVHGSPHSRG